MCELKICKECNIEKPIESFETIRNSKTGKINVYTICKTCKYRKRYLKEKSLKIPKEKKERIIKPVKEYTYIGVYKDMRVDNKQCFQCKEIKQACEFSEIKFNKSKRIALSSYCRKCQNINSEIKRKKERSLEKDNIKVTHNIRSIKAVRQDFNHKSRKDGLNIDYSFITLDWYLTLLENQNGCCGICKKSIEELDRKLFIDHCHDTGEIRGLLCHNCNIGLGAFKDSKDSLIAAVKYLK